jgi:hypothetical protein
LYVFKIQGVGATRLKTENPGKIKDIYSISRLTGLKTRMFLILDAILVTSHAHQFQKVHQMSSMRTKRLGRELAMVRQLDIVDSVDICDQDIGTWQVNCTLNFFSESFRICSLI